MSSMLSQTFEQTLSFFGGNAAKQSDPDITLKELQEAALLKNFRHGKLRKTISGCVAMVKRKCQDLHLPLSQKRECLLMISFLGLFDEDCESLNPFVIKCIEDSKMVCDKAIAYMALQSLNQKSTTTAYLAVNTLLKDLSSRSEVIKCIALNAVCFLTDVDLISVFLPVVEKLLRNDGPMVKCKVFAVLHKMLVVGPEYVVSIWDKVVQALCDKNPHVMSAALPVLTTLLNSSPPPPELKIGKKIVFILKQVEQGRLPIDMMYRGLSGPWIQVRLIAAIRRLPKEELTEHEISELQGIFESIFVRFQCSSHIQCAIIFECISTVISLHPRLAKLENDAFNTIEKFLTSQKSDVFVTGVELLTLAVTVRPGCSKRHVDSLLACLRGGLIHSEKPILRLVDDFATEENVQSLLVALKESMSCRDGKDKTDMLFTVMNLLEKYPSDGTWLLQNYREILGYVGAEYNVSIINKVIKCIQSLSTKSRQDESLKLTRELKKEQTPLQYAIALEVISFNNQAFSEKDCNRVLKAIEFNCSNDDYRRWWTKKDEEDLELISWSTAMTIIVQHRLSTCPKTFLGKIMSPYSGLFEQFEAQACLISDDIELAAKVIPTDYADLINDDFDPDFSFLDDFTKANSGESDEELVADGASASVPPKPEVPRLKSEPYWRSRFDTPREGSGVSEGAKKKVFLTDDKKEPEKASGAWNKSKYDLEKRCSMSDGDEAPPDKNPP